MICVGWWSVSEPQQKYNKILKEYYDQQDPFFG
jgi:hypothetical protein